MKTAFLVIFAITAVTAENVCEPGSFFKVGCNSCSCAEDGQTFACTDMVCPPNELDRLEVNELPEKSCTPGSSFKVDCNDCICSEDGKSAACTDKICPPKITNYDMIQKKSKQVCEPRSTFNDYCNTCLCSEDGTSFGCTMMDCDKNIWNKDGTKKVTVVDKTFAPKQVCKPKSQFKDYCNTCFCSEDGTSFGCTFMFCDKEIWNKDGSMKVMKKSVDESASKQVCQPRSQFKDYCNTCFCSEDGFSFSCTKMYCDKNIWNKNGTSKIEMKSKICEPLSKFKDYCNSCTCSKDGMSAVCTRMFCDKEIWNKDGTSKVAQEVSAPKKVCTSLSKFKDYCNTCFCSEDGQAFTCTRMYCDKDIWNKDGTSKLDVETMENEVSEPKQVCEPLSKFKDYCNTCACAADGTSFVCTRMYCDKNIWNKNGTSKLEKEAPESEVSAPKQACKPRTNFKRYCNTCFCSADGLTYACTRMYCDRDIWNKDGSMKKNKKQVCEPGSAYKVDECNVCICNEDGTDAACTMKLCLPALKRAYRTYSLQKWGPAYKQGDACTPGKQFNSECNSCVCTKSGNSAFCTLMDC